MVTNNASVFSTQEKLPWQTTQWLRLISQVNTGALPHAFLFSGVDGIGKTNFAKRFSALLICEQSRFNVDPTAGDISNLDKSIHDACGTCKQCKLFESDTHPDFKFIEPEDGASSIKIDQIRQLVDFFGQSSQQGGRKIALVSPAEALNNNAANALLKTLEEPSYNSVIILLSHQPGMLLPTIRSRCQVVDFSLPGLQESAEWLNANIKSVVDGEHFSESVLRETLSLAYSAPFKALNYLELGALSEYELMLDELGSLLKNDSLSSTLATRWNDEHAVLRLSWMMLWLEKILKMKFGANLEESHKAQKMFIYLSEKAASSELFDLYSRCLMQYKLFLGTSNPNRILAFESLLHGWSALMRKGSV